MIGNTRYTKDVNFLTPQPPAVTEPTPDQESLKNLTVDEDTLTAYDGLVPKHVAVIMDGNGRWATQRGKRRLSGHHEGANAVRRTVESCRYLGCDTLTLYAFSSQNWGRPEDEVTGLMTLFNIYIRKERKRLVTNGIRLQVIGERDRLGEKLRRAIAKLEDATAHNDDMILQVAVSYGGREELVRAARLLAEEVQRGDVSPEGIDGSDIERHLYTTGRPDPDLIIRTSGEMRLSNFLLWQAAYSELYFTDVLWPDFAEANIIEAFDAFSERERRFGKTRTQLSDDDA